jgi:F-type H+-transporting ATPase subunit alpha
MPVEEQVASIFAGVNGYLDKIAVTDVGRFEKGFLAELRGNRSDLLAAIRDKREITDDIRAGLRDALDQYSKTFA